MELFTVIEEAQAIIRTKGGVFKQTKLYHRTGKVYIGVGNGFIRVCNKFGETWGTTNPAVTVIDMPHDVPGLFIVKEAIYNVR